MWEGHGLMTGEGEGGDINEGSIGEDVRWIGVGIEIS